ncbi:MAG: hypothetical protein H0X27_09540 [Caulobacteraceae bacterium]|nr:hypothetical protein [Caulobacteraceae bacterium]
MHFPHLVGLYRGDRTDTLIVCHISNFLAGVLGATRGRVLLSHDTMRKQAGTHPDLQPEHYQVLPFALSNGEYRHDTSRGGALIIYVDDIRYNSTFRVFLKCTGKRELYVVSFNRMRDRMARKARNKPFPIIREHL